MTKTLTITLPDELESQLLQQAQRLDISLEELVLRSLIQSLQQIDEDDEPKEIVLNSLRKALQDASAQRVRPVAELWDGIDD
jgi:predicted transcriptional regulator